MPLTRGDLVRWEQEKDVDKFIQILRYLNDEKHRPVWRAAVRALKRIHDPAAIYPLLVAVSDYDQKAEKIAMAALQELGPEVIDPLCCYAQDLTQDRNLRYFALRVLNKYNHPRVFDAYLVTLQKGGRISAAITAWIGKMESLDPVLAALGDKAPARRYAAIKGLANSGKKTQVWKPVLAALQDTDVQVRAAALDSLYYMLKGLKKADRKNGTGIVDLVLQPLISTTRDEDFIVRKDSTYCLRLVDHELAKDALIPLLKDPEKIVRNRALHALAGYHSRHILDQLLEIYSDPAESLVTRKNAVCAIINYSPAQATLLLKNMLKNEKNVDLLGVAISSAGELKIHPAIDILLQFLDHNDRDITYEALKAIHDINDPQSVRPLLLQFEKETELSFLMGYCSVFCNLKVREALEPMIRKITSLEEEGVVYFARKIEGILEPGIIKEYLETLNPGSDDLLEKGIQSLKLFLTSKENEE